MNGPAALLRSGKASDATHRQGDFRSLVRLLLKTAFSSVFHSGHNTMTAQPGICSRSSCFNC